MLVVFKATKWKLKTVKLKYKIDTIEVFVKVQLFFLIINNTAKLLKNYSITKKKRLIFTSYYTCNQFFLTSNKVFNLKDKKTSKYKNRYIFFY